MDRFCDYIEIYRPTGDIYNPFGNTEDIGHELVYSGDCKTKQNYSNGVDGECYYDIFINDNEIKAYARDIAYLYNNGKKDDKIKLTILEVKRYERNTIIKSLHLKDGEDIEVPEEEESPEELPLPEEGEEDGED